MPRKRMRSHKRIKIGRNIALLAGAIFATVQGWAHLGTSPEELTPALRYISLDGELIWLWSCAWFLVAVLCVMDCVKQKLRVGLSMFVGVAFTWGLAHVLSVITVGIASSGWLNGIAYIGISGLIFGLTYKITGMQEIMEKASKNTGGENSEDPGGD